MVTLTKSSSARRTRSQSRGESTATPSKCESLQSRIKAIEEVDLSFIDSKLFHSRRAEKECPPLAELTAAAPRTAPKSRSLSSGSVLLAQMCSVPLLSAEEEQLLFRRLNYLKMRATKLRRQLPKAEAPLELVEHIEEHLEEMRGVNDRLIQSNLRLVASLVKKFANENNTFDELFSEGVMSLMRAVEKFDFALGYRFSTYATQAIRRHLYRTVVGRQQERTRFVASQPEVMEEIEDCRTSVTFDEDNWNHRMGLLEQVLGQLDERERYIVECRYGLGDERKVQTLQALAGELGVCKERVRQLQERALVKLTAMASEFDQETLGLTRETSE